MSNEQLYEEDGKKVMDRYLCEKLSLIKNAKNDSEIKQVLNEIYDDGYNDGYDYCETEADGFLVSI